MSVIAAAVKHLMAAGVAGEALLAAIEELEAEVRAEPKPRSAGAIRQERYRERNKASQVTVGDDSDAIPSLSLPPNENNSNPPTHTHPENTPRARKAHRLPVGWGPQPLPAELAETVSRWKPGAIERELARFRDWAASAPGTKGVKSDWDATWRNWLRRKIDEGPTNGRNLRPERKSVLEIASELVADQGPPVRVPSLGPPGWHDR